VGLVGVDVNCSEIDVGSLALRCSFGKWSLEFAPDSLPGDDCQILAGRWRRAGGLRRRRMVGGGMRERQGYPVKKRILLLIL
jgi:hypothetical protein